jgi:hypothetical protein
MMKNKKSILLLAILALGIMIAWLSKPKSPAVKKPVVVCSKTGFN